MDAYAYGTILPFSREKVLIAMLKTDAERSNLASRGYKFVTHWSHREADAHVAKYFYLVYTKIVDSVFRALWLATQSVNIQC